MKVWILFCLLALLIGASYVGYVGWNLTDVVAIPLTSYVAMGIGIIFIIVVGNIIVVVRGLMALMFYSRHGYDEPPSKSPGRSSSVAMRC
jgi:hypothetical protein